MLHHPTLEKLNRLKFTGMCAALTEQQSQGNIEQLSFEERLGLLVDRDVTERDTRRLKIKATAGQTQTQRLHGRSISVTRKVLGSVDRMRMQIDCSDSTFPKVQIYRFIHRLSLIELRGR